MYFHLIHFFISLKPQTIYVPNPLRRFKVYSTVPAKFCSQVCSFFLSCAIKQFTISYLLYTHYYFRRLCYHNFIEANEWCFVASMLSRAHFPIVFLLILSLLNDIGYATRITLKSASEINQVVKGNQKAHRRGLESDEEGKLGRISGARNTPTAKETTPTPWSRTYCGSNVYSKMRDKFCSTKIRNSASKARAEALMHALLPMIEYEKVIQRKMPVLGPWNIDLGGGRPRVQSSLERQWKAADFKVLEDLARLRRHQDSLLARTRGREKVETQREGYDNEMHMIQGRIVQLEERMGTKATQRPNWSDATFQLYERLIGEEQQHWSTEIEKIKEKIQALSMFRGTLFSQSR